MNVLVAFQDISKGHRLRSSGRRFLCVTGAPWSVSSREAFGPRSAAVPALWVGLAGWSREELWEHGMAGRYGHLGCRPKLNNGSCEWHVFTEGLLKMRAGVGMKPQGLWSESFQRMSKTLPIKRRRRQIQEEQQLERERVGGPLPKTQMDSSRKTNPYLFFPSLWPS